MGIVYDTPAAPATAPTGRIVYDEPKRFGTGRSLDNTGEGGLVPSDLVVHAPEGDDTSWLGAAKNVVVGAPEVALSGLTAAGAGLGGAAVGGGQALMNLVPGLPHENAIDAATRFIKGNIHEPQLESAQRVAAGLNLIPAKAGELVGGGARAVGVPEPIANEIEQQTPNVINAALAIAGGPKGAALAERSIRPAAELPPGTNPAQQIARQLEIKLRPSDVQAAAPGTKVPGTAIEGLHQPGALKNKFILDNQQQVTKHAGNDLGLKDAARIDDATFNKLKAPEVKIYRAAEDAATRVPLSGDLQGALQEGIASAKLPPGETTSITRTLSALRMRSTKRIKQNDVATQDAGFADRALADKIEEAFGKQLESVGDAQLFSDFKAARQRLAKIHDVETATRAGQVDARLLYRMKEKNVPLTGRLRMIADVAEAYPEAVKHSLSTARSGVAEVNPTKAGFIKRGVSAVARNVPLTRKFTNVASKGFQNRLGEKATPTQESYFSQYGAKQPAVVPRTAAPNYESVPFTETGGVTPTAASRLAQDLGLAPEAVPGAEVLPPAPGRMTADAIPPVRGDVNFSPAQLEAGTLAGDLGLAPAAERVPGALDYSPAPDLSLAGQLGLELPRIGTKQGKLPVEAPQTERLHLTPSPSEKTAPKITYTVDKGGQHTVRAEGGGEITAKALPDEGRLQIVSSNVPKGLRGQGRGQALAMRLLDEAKKQGLKLVSDIRVSEPAQKMWVALEKRGLKIQRNPAEKQTNGELISKSELKPVFEVIGTAATE